jgi:hypothetical protein
MTGFDLPTNFTEDPESLVRRSRTRFDYLQCVCMEVDPATFVPSTSFPMSNQEKTLREYFAPSATQVPTGSEINTRNGNIEIKTGLITMVQASPFYSVTNQKIRCENLQKFKTFCLKLSAINFQTKLVALS